MYFLSFLKDEYCRVSFGIIRSIDDENRIIHNCITGSGSAGGPILSSKNGKVIGVHFGFKKYNLKLGTLLNQSVSQFLNNLK